MNIATPVQTPTKEKDRHHRRRFLLILFFSFAILLAAGIYILSIFIYPASSPPQPIPEPNPNVDYNLSSITVKTPIIASGSQSLVTLTIYNKLGQILEDSSLAVIFGTTGTGTSTGSFSSAVYNTSTGVYTSNFTGILSGTPTNIIATIDGFPITSTPPTIQVIAGPVDGSQTIIQSNVNLLNADDTSSIATITYIIRDSAGNLIIPSIPGTTVVPNSNGTGTFSIVTNNGDGSFSTTFTSTMVGNNIISGIVNGIAITTSPLPVINVVTASASLSTIQVNSPTCISGNTDQVIITIKNTAGQVINDANYIIIPFITGSGTSTGVFGIVTYLGNGQYSSLFTGIVAGTAVSIDASFSNSNRSLTNITSVLPTITVIAGSIAGAHSLITVTPTTLVLDDPTSTAAVTIITRDSNNNLITTGGATVIPSDSPDGTFTPTTAIDNHDGTYSSIYSPVTIGTKVIGGTVNGITITTTLPSISVVSISVTQTTIAVASSTNVSGTTDLITITIRSANGNIINNPNYTIVGSNSGGSSTGTIGIFTYQTGGTYTANFTGILAGTATTIHATVNSTNIIASSLPTITVTPASANHVIFEQQPTNSSQNIALVPTVTVYALDLNNNIDTNYTNTINLTGASGSPSLTGGSHTASAGIASFSTLTFTNTGTFTLLATGTSISGTATSIPFTIASSGGNTLLFIQQPSNALSTASISPAITVGVYDNTGTTLQTSDNSSIITIGLSNAAGAILSGTLSHTVVNGIATFNNLSIDLANTYHMLATAPGLISSPASSSFIISAGAANKLIINQNPPSSNQAGSTFSQSVIIYITDNAGNLVISSSASVSLIIKAPNSPGGTLSGTTTISAASGIATFSTLSLNKTGAYILTASSSGLTSIDTNSFNITAGAASQLLVSQSPTTTASGSILSPNPIVQVLDANNNVVITSSLTITLAITSPNTPGGTLSGTLAHNAINGIATFTDLSLDKVGTYQLTATTTGGVTSANTTSFLISAGSPDHLIVSTQPATSTAATVTINPNPTFQIVDVNNNLTNATFIISVVLTTPGTATLSGTLSMSATAGTAAFINLSVDKSGSSYTLTATCSSLPNGQQTVITNTFAITAGTATKLIVSVQPASSTVSGATMSPGPSISVTDAGGNVVTSDTRAITVSLTTPNGGTLSGTVTANAIAGVFAFNNLNINKAQSYTITATSSPTLTSAITSVFNIIAGSASKIVFGQQPTGTTSNTTISPSPTILVEDSNNNIVTSPSVSVAVVINNSGTLVGTTTISTISGVATFSTLSVRQANTYALTATSSGLTSAVSNNFIITYYPLSFEQGSFQFGVGGGTSTDISSDGNTAIVGAGTYNSNVGSAWIFTRSGSTWSTSTTLTGSTDSTFGFSVAINNAGTTIAIGAPGAIAGTTSGPQSVIIYTYSGSVWSVQQTLTNSAGTRYFGWSVSLSGDGNTLIVGSELTTVTIYTRSGTTWTKQQTITNPGSPNCEYGYSVNMSDDGLLAAVGLPFQSPGGGVQILANSSGTWSQYTFISGPTSPANFGLSVNLSQDKTTMVGASGTTQVFIYIDSSGTWTLQTGLVAAHIPSDAVLTSDGNKVVFTTAGGLVYVSTRSGTTWTASGAARQIPNFAFQTVCAVTPDGSTAVFAGNNGLNEVVVAFYVD